jgi:PAS domain S-box-containing protein
MTDERLYQQVLDALRQTEVRYRHLIEYATDIIYTHTLDGQITSLNKVVEAVLGYRTDELIGKPIQDLIAPEHRELSRMMMSEKLEKGESTRYTVNALTKSGHRVPLEVATQMIYDEGVPFAVQGIARDVTERQRSAEALARSESYFRALIENAADAVTILNDDATVRYSSPALQRIIGYAPSERRTQSVFELVHPEDVVHAVDAFNKCRQSANATVNQTVRALHRDGTWRHIEFTIVNLLTDPHIEGLVLNWRDITDKIVAQQTLRDREHFYRAITERSSDIIAIIDPAPAIRYLSPSFETVLRHKISDVIGTPGFQLVHPDDVPRAMKILELLITAGREMVTEELRIVDARGHYHDMDIRARNLLRDPTIRGIVVDMRDVTDRKRAERALRASEERFRKVLETSGEGIVMRDQDGFITFANERFAEMMGQTVQQLLGRHVDTIVVPEHLPALQASAERRRRTGRSETLDLQFQREDGSRMDAILAASPMYDEKGNFTGSLGMITDMTERKRLEEQLRQSQKMEAVGRLAGGVAHDFNNLLTAIRGHVDLLLDDNRIDTATRSDIEEIRKAADRAAALTQQLLAFSRRQMLQPVVLEFDGIVREMESLLRRLIAEDISLRTNLTAGSTRVRADRGQIEQVLLNLVVNARDAMPNGGDLFIETANVELDEEFVRSNEGASVGPHARLSVRDTGIGMDAATLSHIFEPFFTTKAVGKGTGLGLATVYGIVKQSGGYIRADSEVGVGTTFEIFLPHVQDPLQRPREVPVEKHAQAAGETILVAEDEDAVRALTSRILRKRGYNVLEAKDGREAVNVALAHRGEIRLLVTDVIMPHLNGRELSERIAKVMPHVKVLYMSGYTDDALLQRGVLQSGTGNFLEKPFTPEALAKKVREVLETE